jgi:hypothetical protein
MTGKDAKFDRRLQKRLGNSYDTYMAMIEELNRSAEAFRQKLKLDASWKVCVKRASRKI